MVAVHCKCTLHSFSVYPVLSTFQMGNFAGAHILSAVEELPAEPAWLFSSRCPFEPLRGEQHTDLTSVVGSGPRETDLVEI